jgi:hypothetical protein
VFSPLEQFDLIILKKLCLYYGSNFLIDFSFFSVFLPFIVVVFFWRFQGKFYALNAKVVPEVWQ